jgi:hypothetical protein
MLYPYQCLGTFMVSCGRLEWAGILAIVAVILVVVLVRQR